jgi:hypothetical protein
MDEDIDVTSIKILDSEDEFDQLRKKRAELDFVNVTLQGLDLPETSVKRLESQIKDAIKEEREKLERERLERSRTTQMRREKPITISLEGLNNLPESSLKRLESQIEDIITRYIGKDVNQPGSGSGERKEAVCICMNTGVPGETRSFSSLPLPTPTRYPFTIGMSSREDAIRMEIHDPAVYPVPPGEVVVSLQSDPAVRWEKRIRSYNICNIFTSTILATKDDNHGGFYNQYRILKPNCANGTHTLVFAKAKFLGTMTNMYNIDYRQFWQAFSGKRLHIVWVAE